MFHVKHFYLKGLIMKLYFHFVLLLFSSHLLGQNIISTASVVNPKIISKPIYLSETSWQNNLNANDSIFQKSIQINNLTNSGIIKSSASKFLQNVNIADSTNYNYIESIFSFFKGALTLYNITSKADIALDSSVFSKSVLFSNLDCFGSLFLRLSAFFDTLTIEHSNINSIDISKATFNKKVKIINSVFHNTFKANRTNFKDDVLIYLVRFTKGLSLTRSEFMKKIEFKQVTINDFLDLSYVKADTINLSHVHNSDTLNTKIKLNLSNSQIKNLQIDFNYFELVFSPSLDFNEISAFYEKLLETFKEDPSNYRQIFLQYNQFKHQHKDQPWIDNFLKNFWNYGLDKSKPFTWLGWIFLFFTCINAIFYPEISKKCLSISFLPDGKEDSVDKNPVTRLVYYLPYSIFLTIFLFLSSFILSLRVLFPVIVKKEELILLSNSKRMLILTYFFSIIVIGYAYILFLFAFLINPE
jgi:ACT domain-containing protein